MNHDQLHKQLLTTFLYPFLQLFFPKLAEAVKPDSITFLDKEIFTDITGGDRREVDLIARAQFLDGNETFFIIHVESQAKREGKFNERMFLYFGELFALYRLPIYPVAFLSYDRPATPEPNSLTMDFPDGSVLGFYFRTVQLNRLSWRDFLRHPNPVAAALLAKMQVAEEDRPRVKLEVVRMMTKLVLDPARQALVKHFSDAYLSLTPAELTVYNQNMEQIASPEREEILQFTNSWEEKGRAEGLMTGRVEGRVEGEQKIARQMLRRRLGAAAEEFLDAVSTLSETQLSDLADAVFDFNDAQDARVWFSNQR